MRPGRQSPRSSDLLPNRAADPQRTSSDLRPCAVLIVRIILPLVRIILPR